MEKMTRPPCLQSMTTKIKVGCGSLYVTISVHEGEIFEVFAVLGKAGGCMDANMEAITRCITTGLRYGIPVEEYIDQLSEIKCPNPVLFPKKSKVLSCADAIASVLSGKTWLSLQGGEDK